MFTGGERAVRQAANGPPRFRQYGGSARSRAIWRLLRRHPDRAVEADRLAVQHRVLDDRAHELRELAGPAETRRERHHLAERILYGSLDIVGDRAKEDALAVFKRALDQ